MSCPAQAQTLCLGINKTSLWLLGTLREHWKVALWCPHFLLRMPNPWNQCSSSLGCYFLYHTFNREAWNKHHILAGLEMGVWKCWSSVSNWVLCSPERNRELDLMVPMAPFQLKIWFHEHQNVQHGGALMHLAIRFYWWTWRPNFSPTHPAILSLQECAISKLLLPFSLGQTCFPKEQIWHTHHTKVARETHPNTTRYRDCKASWI